MLSGSRIALEFEQGLGHLRLARADRTNAIDPAWVGQFAAAVEACAKRDDLRALLISADGRAFTVGGDLRHFAARAEDLAAALEEIVPRYHEALERLAMLELPVLAAVQGAAAGGGLGLLFCSDIVIAAADARFVCGFTKLGLSGDGGGTWFLPRLVGLRRAQELLFGDRVLSAPEAAEWGLVTRVVAPESLIDEALGTARKLALGPTFAFGEIRRLLREGATDSLGQHLSSEARAMVRTGATADAREGVKAFVERREPRFSGGDRA